MGGAKRLVGASAGMLYAVAYGVLTLFASIYSFGLHGDSFWTLLFVTTFFFGLFFPIAGYLVVNLDPRWAQFTLTTLLLLNALATFYTVFGLLGAHGWREVADSWREGPSVFLIMLTIHSLPIAALWIISLRKFVLRRRARWGDLDLHLEPPPPPLEISEMPGDLPGK